MSVASEDHRSFEQILFRVRTWMIAAKRLDDEIDPEEFADREMRAAVSTDAAEQGELARIRGRRVALDNLIIENLEKLGLAAEAVLPAKVLTALREGATSQIGAPKDLKPEAVTPTCLATYLVTRMGSGRSEAISDWTSRLTWSDERALHSMSEFYLRYETSYRKAWKADSDDDFSRGGLELEIERPAGKRKSETREVHHDEQQRRDSTSYLEQALQLQRQRELEQQRGDDFGWSR